MMKEEFSKSPIHVIIIGASGHARVIADIIRCSGNIVDDFVHLSPGVHLSGTVGIGSCSWLGVSAAVGNNVNICDGYIIGAGAVVVKDTETVWTYVGVSAKEVKMKNLCNVTKISGWGRLLSKGITALSPAFPFQSVA